MIRSGIGSRSAPLRAGAGLCAAVLAALSLSPVGASAQPSPADRTQAEALFNEAKKLLKEGNVAEACRKLEGSYRIDPAGGTVLNLATCHEKEGRIASAWGEFKEALAAAKKANRKDREKIARDRIDALEPRLPYLVVIPEQQDMKDLSVVVDENAIAREAWGAQLPIDPGTHIATAKASGHEDWKGEFEAAEGKKVTVRVPALKVAKPAPTASASAPVAPVVPEIKYPWMRPSGIAIGTVGVAAIVAGAVFGARALDLGGKAKKECDAQNACSEIGLAAVQDGRTSATASDVLLGAGAGFAAIGVAFFILGGATTQPSATGRARVAPVARISTSGATFGLEGAW